MGKQAATGPGKEWAIEPRGFSERREVAEATLDGTQLARLAAEAEAPLEAFTVRVAGLRSPRGHPGIAVEVDGRIRLTCQRCMQPLDLALAPRAKFEWAKSEAALDGDEDDEWDLLPPAARFDLLPLVEDELLLALPYAPMHEFCSPTAATSAGEKVRPFAALAALKAGAGGGK